MGFLSRDWQRRKRHQRMERRQRSLRLKRSLRRKQHPGLVNVWRMILDPRDCWINERIFATPTLHMIACNIATIMAIDMRGFSMDINAFVETILHQTIELEQTQIV